MKWWGKASNNVKGVVSFYTQDRGGREGMVAILGNGQG